MPSHPHPRGRHSPAPGQGRTPTELTAAAIGARADGNGAPLSSFRVYPTDSPPVKLRAEPNL